MARSVETLFLGTALMIEHAATASVAIALGLAPSCAIQPAAAQTNPVQIVVLSANVFTGTLDELVREFERTTGHGVTVVYGTAGAIRQRVEAGEFSASHDPAEADDG